MGYYSDIRVTLTKDDYISILNKNERANNICRFLPDIDDPYIRQYKENGKEFVMVQLYDMKYYKEFEDVQQFEKFLKEVKSGYVFFRAGGRWDDFEYRNNAKYKELEIPFKFIKTIQDKTIKQILNSTKEYKNTFKKYVFLNKDDILEFYKYNKKMHTFIKEQYNENSQFKLFLEVDMNKKEALSVLHIRKPEEDKYSEYRTEYINKNSALLYLGYPNEEVFLNEINNNEEEEEFE